MSFFDQNRNNVPQPTNKARENSFLDNTFNSLVDAALSSTKTWIPFVAGFIFKELSDSYMLGLIVGIAVYKGLQLEVPTEQPHPPVFRL